jgi:glycosyltransferase involved in cell wall biosynthesis
MRVLHTLAGPNLGGLEFRVLEQAAWMRDRGHAAFIAAHPDSAIVAAARRRSLQVVPIDFNSPYAPWTILKLRRAVKALGIDVIDAHSRPDAKTGALCQDLCGVVRTRHFSDAMRSSPRLRRDWRRGCHRIVATCREGAHALFAAGFATPDRVSMVGEWAAEDFFAKADRPDLRKHMRRHFSLAADSYVVAVVGMLRSEKRQDDVLRVVRHLRERAIPAVALVVGSTAGTYMDYERSLHALAQDLEIADAVVFAGFRPDIADVIQAADVVMVPSVNEAWSRIVPEAFAARRPVVASRVGGLPELVKPGVTGWLAEPRDIDGFADAIQQIRAQPERTASIVDEARRHAERHLRLDGKMAETLRVYETALSCARRGKQQSTMGNSRRSAS